MPEERTNSNPEDFGLSGPWFEFNQSVRRHRELIRAVTLATVVIVVLGSWLQRPVYRATASVLIDMETPSVVAVSATRDDATIAQTNFFAYADYYRTQLEVISSRALAEQVFENLKLGQEKPYRRTKNAVSALMTQIRIEPVKQTRLARIHVEDHDPKRAARIANELAVVYTLENLNRASATETLILAKTEYLELQRKEAELSKRYKAKHPAAIRVRKEMEQLAKTIEEGLKPGEGPAVASHLRPNNIRIQDLAQVPTRPVRPKRLLNLLLGLLFGLVGGIGLAVAMDLADTSLKTPDDLSFQGKVPLLGHIPRMDGARGSLPSQEFKDHVRFAHLEDFSPAAEAYRAIRTSLLFTSPLEKTRTILFTSPGPGEGKTTTLCNLGAAVAQSGAKILLIDADMRRGQISQVFSIRRSPGLSEVLLGKASPEEAVQPTEVPNLWVIPSGQTPRHPAELVGTEPMRRLIEWASGRYDRVFVDSPPIMAVTDATVLAAMIKAVIAVVQSGKTPHQALRRVVKTCHDVQARVLGAILNNVPIWSTPYHYRYSSYGYYRPRTQRLALEETPPRASAQRDQPEESSLKPF